MSVERGHTVDFSKLPQPFLARHPEWTALYNFAWKTAAKNIRKSRGRFHMDAAWDPARNFQWVWDTCFMALYCRYGSGQYPGVQSLDNFYELQAKDGHIGMTYDMTTGEEAWPNRINPPLFAWVEWEHYLATGDSSRFGHATRHIERLMRWIDKNRMTEPHRCLRASDSFGDGRGESKKLYQLYYFEDGGSSGMDDSPRTPRKAESGRFFDWIDLSCQMAFSFKLLSQMYGVIGNAAKSRTFATRAAAIGKTINRELWCQNTRFYHDRTLPENFVASKTAAGFWPLLAGICPEERVEALVQHLQNKKEFNRPTPVPSLSADDPNYSEHGVYWLGGVWAPTNYMITRGLMNTGRGDVAHDIACRYLAALARTYAGVKPHTLWECYSPEADLPGIAPYTGERVKPHFVGWTGIGPIAMLIENVIGLDLNVPERKITWDIRLIEEHGIRQMPIGSGKADFFCAKRSSQHTPAEIRVESQEKSAGKFTLLVRRGNRARTVIVQQGKPATLRV